jgi:hypothetical protein
MRMPRLTLITATALLLTGAASASAQCTIYGPDTICPGETIELCAAIMPNAMTVWQGPDGTVYEDADCIDVNLAGLYTLKYQNLTDGSFSAPCSLMVAGTAAPSVTGPNSTCAGTAVQWRGPTGDFDYAWNGPNGFASDSMCVMIGTAGDYMLKVRPLPDGCWSDSTVRTLTVNDCTAPAASCPRAAWWWERQLSRHGGMSADAMALVAACVNDRSSFFNWTTPADGFRLTLVAFHKSLKLRAARQVATVWANVCAGSSDVSDHGTAVSLVATATLTLPGTSGTVGAWLATADAQLIALDSQPEHSQAVRAAYRRIIQVAWNINHGIGIGATCTSPAASASVTATSGANGGSVDMTDPEPLLSEMLDDSAGPLTLGDLSPNPFSSTTRLAFAVSTGATAEVSIDVYDLNGRKVRELVHGPFAPGQYETSWNGLATDGTPVKSGVYFVLGRVGGQQVQSRVTFVR